MKLDWEYLADTMEEARTQINKASRVAENGKSFFFVVRKDAFSEVALKPAAKKEKMIPEIFNSPSPDKNSTRLQALEVVQKHKNKDTVFISTTGKTSRELCELADSPNNLYMVGSMGCASPLGLGLALAQRQKNIILIDGDGSLLMRMGTMPVLGHYQPDNLLHVLLDNNCYDSTGGQATVSDDVDFIEVAQACGYTFIYHAHDLIEFDQAIEKWEKAGGLGFIHLKIAKGSKSSLGRPKLKPSEVKERFIRFIQEAS
jgi:phosphonopyruvate decarboxylase